MAAKATDANTGSADELTPAALDDDIDRVIDDWARLRPTMDAAPIGVFGRITRIHNNQRAVLNVLYDEFDLTLASFDVLANLLRSGKPHRKTAGELANSSMLTT